MINDFYASGRKDTGSRRSNIATMSAAFDNNQRCVELAIGGDHAKTIVLDDKRTIDKLIDWLQTARLNM